MEQRSLVALVVGLLAIGAVAAVLAVPGSSPTDPLDGDQSYPEGTGPDHINFSALKADGTNVSNAPRAYWDTYAILYSTPEERRLVEGEYYIDATTGAIVGHRWHDGRVYINGSTYAFVQPADSLPDHQREQIDSDPQFVYDESTDAYYRYDPHYGAVAPTNIGRHPDILRGYTWTATNTTTHHGVPVITYRVTGVQSTAADIPPPRNGTLRLGMDDGVVYAFDLTLDADGDTYRYTYDVRPEPFPDTDWVDTARAVTAANESAE